RDLFALFRASAVLVSRRAGGQIPASLVGGSAIDGHACPITGQPRGTGSVLTPTLICYAQCPNCAIVKMSGNNLTSPQLPQPRLIGSLVGAPFSPVAFPA